MLRWWNPTFKMVKPVLSRHWPNPGCQEAEAFSILEAEAFTLLKLEAEALVTKPKPNPTPGYL